MLKALLKKQFLSLFKKGKNGKGSKGYVAILAVLCLCMGFTFFSYGKILSVPLAEQGLGWLYFAYSGILSLVFAVVGGIFMAQSYLYEAKDNELLLSLPIPSKYILFIRMVPLYAQNFLFGAVVLLPAAIAWCTTAAVTAGQVVIWLLMLILQPLLTLFISCLLGFVVALITSHMANKTLFTALISIIFLVAYLIVYMLLINNMDVLITGSEQIGEGIKGAAYPIYALGMACMGSFAHFGITAAICIAPFAILYVVLSLTYIKFVTARKGGRQAKYNGKTGKPSKPLTALIKKEMHRFFGSGVYLLNAGLGVVFLFILTIFFAVKGAPLVEKLSSIELLKDAVPLVAVIVIGMVSAMDEVSAPSVSLEGKTLWILQSSPVELWRVIKAKLIWHYIVTAPAATVCTAVFAIFLQPSAAMIILMLISPSVAVTLSGVLGLTFNLIKPNLNWDNETAVIKQSMSVLLTMLSVWFAFIAVAALYFAARLVMSAELYLLIALLLLTAACVPFIFWLKKKGVKILENL